jgi:hypothetical protein
MHAQYRTHRQAAGLAALAALTLALAGCGSSSPGTGSTSGTPSGSSTKASSTPKACDLVTAAIAGDVLGKPAKKTHAATLNTHETQCQYSGPKAFASVIAGDCTFMKQFTAPTGGKPVSGVGDSGTATAGASGLQACKGDLALNIDVGIAGTYSGAAATSIEDQQLLMEKNLANKIFDAS